MRAASVHWSLLLLALGTLPAFAQQRVVVENFPKDKHGTLRAQVAAALCAQVECVPPSRVTVRKKLDWHKVSHERVQAVVSGSVTSSKLTLTLVNAKKKILLQKTLKLAKNRLAPKPLGVTIEEILAALSPPPAQPPPVSEPPKVTELPPVDLTTPPTPSTSPDTAPTHETSASLTSEPTEPTVKATESAPAAEATSPHKKRVYPILVAEVGAEIAGRSLSVAGLETGNIYGWSGPVVMPSLHLEVYPFAPLTNTVLGGLGVTGDVAFSAGLNSKLADGTTYPTHMTRYDVGIKWAIRPIHGSSFNFGPEVGYKNQSFVVSPGTNGTALDALPDLTYSGMDVGLGLEIPLGGFGTLSARGAYLPVFSASRLLSADYFPSGSASGFTGEVGLGFFVGLGSLLEVRLSGIFTQYNLYFTDVGASDKYRATGTTDRYIGGRLGLRVRW
jgi:hypothetical protein